MDVIGELYYTAELIIGLSFNIVSLVTLDSIEYRKDCTYFLDKRWTPPNHAVYKHLQFYEPDGMVNDWEHRNSIMTNYIFYNGHMIEKWNEREHWWKKGHDYVCHSRDYVLSFNGGIINSVYLKNNELYDINTFYGRLAIVDLTYRDCDLPHNTPVNADTVLLLEGEYRLVKNNGNYKDCFGKPIKSKYVFLDGNNEIYLCNKLAGNWDKVPYFPAKVRWILKEITAPERIDVDYYAENLMEVIEKYFPQVLVD